MRLAVTSQYSADYTWYVLPSSIPVDCNKHDEFLPGHRTALLACLASLGIAIAAVPYIAIGLPVLGAVIYLLQLSYLRTSRQLRLLESVPAQSLRYCT